MIVKTTKTGRKRDPNRIGAGKPGPGRPKGSQTKTTIVFKRMVEMALDRLGPDHLLWWARQNPTEFYRIAARLIPTRTQVSGLDGEPIEVRQVDMPPRPASYDEWIEQRAVGRWLPVVASGEQQ